MIQYRTALETKRNERHFCLVCDNDSPLGEVFDVLCEMREYVIGRMQEVQKKDKPQSQEEVKDVNSP
jgi:hypothetical protein